MDPGGRVLHLTLGNTRPELARSLSLTSRTGGMMRFVLASRNCPLLTVLPAQSHVAGMLQLIAEFRIPHRDLHLEILAEPQRVGMEILAVPRSHIPNAQQGQPARILASLSATPRG